MKIMGIGGGLGFGIGGGGGYWLTQYQDQQALLWYSRCECVPMLPAPGHAWYMAGLFAVLGCGVGLMIGGTIERRRPKRSPTSTVPLFQEPSDGVWAPAPKA